MLTGVHWPSTSPDGSGGDLTRRTVLGGSAVLGLALLTGCTSEPEPAPSDTPAPVPDADAQVRDTVAAEEAALIALYDAAIAAHPGLAGDLTPLRDQHVAHAEAMGSAPQSGQAVGGVGSRPQALAALKDAEQRAIAQRTSACEAATGIDTARTIALIAASEAGHAEYLRGLT
jgi:hypothetical protein